MPARQDIIPPSHGDDRARLLLTKQSNVNNLGKHMVTTVNGYNEGELSIFHGRDQGLLQNNIDFNFDSQDIADDQKKSEHSGALKEETEKSEFILPPPPKLIPDDNVRTTPSSTSSGSGAPATMEESASPSNETMMPKKQTSGKRIRETSDGNGGDSWDGNRKVNIKSQCESDTSSNSSGSSDDSPTFLPARSRTQEELNKKFEQFITDEFDEDHKNKIARLQSKIQHAYLAHRSTGSTCKLPTCNSDQVKIYINNQVNKFDPKKPVVDANSKVFQAAMQLHALQCQLKDCEVPLCAVFKNRIPKPVQDGGMGEVIYSNTTVLCEKQKVFNGVDFWFVCEREIARGAFGSVSEVWFNCKNVDVKLALKRYQNDAFNKDAQYASLINGHPNINAPQIVIKNGPKYGLAFYEAGMCSLHDYCQSFYEVSKSRLPLNLATFFIRQVITGVVHMHRLGLLHRDIKPMNIILMSGFDARLIDFDAVIPTTQAASQSINEREIKGTAGFTAPEIFEAKHPDGYATEKSESYSICKTLADLVVGGQFFNPRALSAEQCRNETLRRDEILIRSCGNPLLKDLLTHGLNRDRNKRQDAALINLALEQTVPSISAHQVPRIPILPHVSSKDDSQTQQYVKVVDSIYQNSGINRRLNQLDKNLPPLFTPSTVQQQMASAGFQLVADEPMPSPQSQSQS